jgi:thiamine-phosphate pyrophosphorylase
VTSARSIIGPECWVGRSVHNAVEVQRADDEGADYVVLGPIWPTVSHPGTEPLGLDALSFGYDLPVIAIGGITPERVPECIQSGAYGVALISAIWYAQDVTSAARDLSLSFPP